MGLSLGYVLGADVHELVTLAQEADRLGYSVVWSAEAYGSDAATVLAYVAAKTERIDVGSAVFQIPARTPAMTAMTAATMDLLSGGRFRLGLGVSGPQVSEGWHGVRFAKPLARTREYVDIVNQALARQTVSHDGEFFTLPLPDGPGKALKLTVHPVREHIPTYLAAVGPKNLELAGEIADGWLAIFFSPGYAAESLASIEAGRARGDKAGPALRRRGHRPRGDRPRRRAVRDADPPVRGAVCRRDGEPGAELLQPARLPDGVRGRGQAGPGPLPRPAASRGDGRRTAGLHRPDLADRTAGADRGAAARLRRSRGDHPDGDGLRTEISKGDFRHFGTLLKRSTAVV